MNFIGISVLAAALISVSMGLLGANYEKPVKAESVTHQSMSETPPAI